jgi:threonine 3-dehydrogenase
MKIVVTGAGGQIGQDLVAELEAREHEVFPTDLYPPDEIAGIPCQQLDVTDAVGTTAVLADHRPDVVIHLAAILSASGEKNPQWTYEVNQGGMYNVLEACRRLGVPRLVFASTIAVYGPDVPDPTPDNVGLHPTTMYGVTKVGGELLGEYYFKKYGLDFRGIRFPGLISASLPGGGSSDYALFMYVDAIRKGYYEAFCRPDTRIPLMYMPDGVRALAELSEAESAKLHQCVYNIAAFSPTAKEIAESVIGAVPEAEITFEPDPVRQAILDSWPGALDDRRARADWGWKPRFTLDEMTEDLIPRVRKLLAERSDALDHDH